MSTRMYGVPIVLVMLASCILLDQQPLAAQPVDAFSQIALRVNLDDRVVVTERTGHTTSGRLLEMSGDNLAIDTTEGRHTLTSTELKTLALRTRRVRGGVLLGAASGMGAGAIAACTGSDRSECPDGPLMAGAAGAGLGALIGALLTKETRVYDAADASSPSTHALAGMAADAMRRVNLDDHVRIDRTSGSRVTGRLRDVSTDDFLIVTSDGEVRVPTADVRKLAVRRYQPARGALIGAAAFAALALASPRCRENDNCSPLSAAPFGAGLGLAFGAVIPRLVTVVPGKPVRTSWSPALTRGGAGINASMRW